jgi:hypothetical protein
MVQETPRAPVFWVYTTLQDRPLGYYQIWVRKWIMTKYGHEDIARYPPQWLSGTAGVCLQSDVASRVDKVEG